MLTLDIKGKIGKYHPDAVKQLEIVYRMAEDSIEPALLDLCGSYIDAALEEKAWQPPYELSGREKAFIDVTEQFVSSVSTMNNEQIQALLEFSPANDIYLFINSLYVIEMTKRMSLVADKVLS